MNDVVDKVRRDEQNRLKGEGKRVIKGLRHLLLRILIARPGSRLRMDEAQAQVRQ